MLYPDRFNWDNLFFLYNNRPAYNLVGIEDLLKYAPQIFAPEPVTQPRDKWELYGIHQIWPRFHNQKFNFFLRHNKWTLNESDFPYVPLIPQRVLEYKGRVRDRVIILPTAGKKYHMERNQTDDMIINLINTLPKEYKHVYIINKDVYKRDLTDVIKRSGRHITVLGDEQAWNELVDIATQLCDMYVGGDCGFSHLLASMHGSPMKFHIFYRTRLSDDNQASSQRKHVVNKKPKDKVLMGIDNVTKIDQRVQSIYKRQVIFQDNQDGIQNKPQSSYAAQSLI